MSAIIFLSASASVYSNTVKHPGPSFSCNKVTGGIEKNICESSELSQLDLALGKAYKIAKAIDPNIKHEQRLWIKQRNKCKGERQACLKKSYLSRIEALQLTVKRGIKLPAGWEGFYLSRWLKTLNKTCSAGWLDEAEQHERLVRKVRLSESTELLSLACFLGAYQDSHLVYLITIYDNAPYAKQVTFIRPVHKEGWRVFLTDKIVGYLMIHENRQTFNVSVNSGGAGACGYNVTYNVSDLYQASPLKPVSLKGEDDCEKGIAPDDWPNIPLPLPLTTGSNEW